MVEDPLAQLEVLLQHLFHLFTGFDCVFVVDFLSRAAFLGLAVEELV